MVKLPVKETTVGSGVGKPGLLKIVSVVPLRIPALVIVPSTALPLPVWLASLNGPTAPRQLTTIDTWRAHFGAPGEVVFAGEEKSRVYIYRIKDDGSELQKVIPTPIAPFGVSPDG